MATQLVIRIDAEIKEKLMRVGQERGKDGQ